MGHKNTQANVFFWCPTDTWSIPLKVGGSSSGGGGGARFREMSGLTRHATATEMISHQTTKTTQGSFLDVKVSNRPELQKTKRIRGATRNTLLRSMEKKQDMQVERVVLSDDEISHQQLEERRRVLRLGR